MDDLIIFLIILGIVGIFFFFYFLFKRRYRHASKKPIEHYEEIRDKVTLKEAKVKVEDEIGGGSFLSSLSGLALGIVIFSVVIGVGVTVLNEMSDIMGTQQNTLNVSSEVINALNPASGVFSWIPTIIALVIGFLFISIFIRSYMGGTV